MSTRHTVIDARLRVELHDQAAVLVPAVTSSGNPHTRMTPTALQLGTDGYAPALDFSDTRNSQYLALHTIGIF